MVSSSGSADELIIQTVSRGEKMACFSRGVPLSSGVGMKKTVKARSWLWLEPFSLQKSLNLFELLFSRSTEDPAKPEEAAGVAIVQPRTV